MASHTNPNVDIHDENNYDPITYVPKAHSHGTKDIWVKFWILLALTLVDVVLYFAMPPSMARNIIFIALGVIKAIYIVGTFMHMKHEKLSLASMIVLPMFFIIFFLVWMMAEGAFWGTF